MTEPRRWCPLCSPLARPTCHCRIPNSLSLDIKDEVGVGRRSGPVIARELTFQLTRGPTCVAECHQHFLRTDLVSDVAKHLLAWTNGGEVFHRGGAVAIVVSAVYDEADPGLHGAARKDLHATFSRGVALAKKLQKLRQ